MYHTSEMPTSVCVWLLTLGTCSVTRLLLTFCNVHVTAEYCMTLLIPSALTLHVKSVQLTAAHPFFLLNPNQEVYSGKFEKYNYGSSEANRKHYNQVCDVRGGGRGRGRGGSRTRYARRMLHSLYSCYG